MKRVVLAVTCGMFASGTALAQTLPPPRSGPQPTEMIGLENATDTNDRPGPAPVASRMGSSMLPGAAGFDASTSATTEVGAERGMAASERGRIVHDGIKTYTIAPDMVLEARSGFAIASLEPPLALAPAGHALRYPVLGQIEGWKEVASRDAMQQIARESFSPSAAAGQDAASALAPMPPLSVETQTDEASSSSSPTDSTDEIVVTAADFHHAPGDPFERINAVSFALTEKVDKAVLGPVARSYDSVVPKPIRRGIRNFLNNLREPVVLVNYLLQLKPGKAAETVGRFAINTTLGLAGVIDVAKRCPFNLPWRPNGFSDTLGVYGVKEGPYIFVPLIGPTTMRDLVGGAVDRVASPLALGGPFKSKPYLIGSNIYRVLDRRAEQEDELQAARATDDPYAARRDQYLSKRKARVARLKGELPEAEPRQEPTASEPSAPLAPPPPPAGKRSRCTPVQTPDDAAAK